METFSCFLMVFMILFLFLYSVILFFGVTGNVAAIYLIIICSRDIHSTNYFCSVKFNACRKYRNSFVTRICNNGQTTKRFEILYPGVRGLYISVSTGAGLLNI